MSFNENLRGQTNSIILFILINGDRHTDELKEIIDEKFSTVKIGTLYSVIARMKTQGQISEYRASSSDGSRRKYYKITEVGKKLYNAEYSQLFTDITLPQKQEPEKEVKSEVVVDDNEELYLKYIKKAETAESYSDIDFSSVPIKEPKTEEVALAKEPQPKQPKIEEQLSLFTSYEQDFEDQPKEKDVDYDSVVSSEYEYKSVLSKLFPKTNPYAEDYAYESNYQVPQEEVKIEPEIVKEEQYIPQNTAKFDTIYDLSEKENIKIRTSNDTNRYQGTKILANKLRFHSAILIGIIAVLEYLITTLMFGNSIEFDKAKLIEISVIFGIFALVMCIIYILRHNYAVKDLPKFINSIEIAIVITIATVIVSLCVASISGINMYDFAEIYYSIILPAIMSFNLPLYVTIVHFLSKLDTYQTI